MKRVVYSVRDAEFMLPVKWRYLHETESIDEYIDVPIIEIFEDIYYNSGLNVITQKEEIREKFDRSIKHKMYCLKENHKKCPKKISTTAYYIIKNYHHGLKKTINEKNDKSRLLASYTS